MKKFALIALVFCLCTASAQNIAGYIRAREFALRFTNVIGTTDQRTFTIGREGEHARRLIVTAGSRYARIMTGSRLERRILLERAVKVDLRGLLIPPSAVRWLGCTAYSANRDTVQVGCDKTIYGLQRFMK